MRELEKIAEQGVDTLVERIIDSLKWGYLSDKNPKAMVRGVIKQAILDGIPTMCERIRKEYPLVPKAPNNATCKTTHHACDCMLIKFEEQEARITELEEVVKIKDDALTAYGLVVKEHEEENAMAKELLAEREWKEAKYIQADEVTLAFFQKYLDMPKGTLEELCQEIIKLKAQKPEFLSDVKKDNKKRLTNN